MHVFTSWTSWEKVPGVSIMAGPFLPNGFGSRRNLLAPLSRNGQTSALAGAQERETIHVGKSLSHGSVAPEPDRNQGGKGSSVTMHLPPGLMAPGRRARSGARMAPRGRPGHSHPLSSTPRASPDPRLCPSHCPWISDSALPLNRATPGLVWLLGEGAVGLSLPGKVEAVLAEGPEGDNTGGEEGGKL